MNLLHLIFGFLRRVAQAFSGGFHILAHALKRIAGRKQRSGGKKHADGFFHKVSLFVFYRYPKSPGAGYKSMPNGFSRFCN
jgi:hypothetical protein